MIKNKSIYIISILTLIVVIFISCQKEVKEETKNTLDKAITVTEATFSKEVKNSKDEVIANVKITYPVLFDSDNNPNIKELNENLKNEANRDFPDYVEEYTEIASREDSINLPYTYERSFRVTFNKDNIISILTTEYSNTNGAYPNIINTGNTYDLNTGCKLELKDIFSLEEDNMYNQIEKKFIELYANIDSLYYGKDSINENIRNIKFYLEDNNINLFFDESVIGPHVLGAPMVSLLIDGDMFNERITKAVIK